MQNPEYYLQVKSDADAIYQREDQFLEAILEKIHQELETEKSKFNINIIDTITAIKVIYEKTKFYDVFGNACRFGPQMKSKLVHLARSRGWNLCADENSFSFIFTMWPHT